MGYISAIAQVVGTGISLLGRSGSPDYPAPPKLYKLPVAKARKTMEAYEARRMKASIGAWKDRFPLLYKGGQAEIDDIRAQQQGRLGRTVTDTLTKSGLDAPTASSPEALGLDIGLNPLALSQRSSQAVMRQIAMNPEWTNKITGGTLASMMANANANANAFNGFLGAQRAAMYQKGRRKAQ